MENEDASRSDKAELAYAIWSSEAGGDTQKTADLSGIPRSTVQRYMREDGWQKRHELEQLGDTAEAVILAANMVRAGMPQVVESMQMICYGTKPLINAQGHIVTHPDTGRPVMVALAENKDKVAAGRWLLQFGLMGAIDILRDGNAPSAYDTPYGANKDIGAATPSRSEQARDILNANYALANTRKSRR